MKIAAETPVRSERDEKIITNLRRKVHDYGFDLTKAERDLLNAQAKLAKSAEEHARLTHRLKQKYDKQVAILQKKLVALENKMLQDQNNTDAQVLEARAQQIGRLLQEKGVIRMRIKEIADYVVMKCHECEDMTRPMFFAFVMTFVRQDEIFRKVKSLEQSLKNMQGIRSQVSVSYKDLCLFPDVQLPSGFKMPKFDLYDGHGDPVAHLRGFCGKMRGAGGKDELLMAWREQAARVNPPMEENEMVEYFLQALELTYFGHLISAIGKSFNDVVKKGGMVEEELKSSKIMSYSAIKATTQAIQNGTGSLLGKKKKDDVAMFVSGSGLRQLDVLRPIEPKTPNPPPRNLDYSFRCTYCSDAPGHDIEKCWHLKRVIQELIDTNQIVVQSPETPNINQNPLPAHAETYMIEIVLKDGEPKNSSKSVMMIRASESNPVKAPDFAKAMPLTVEGVSEKLSTLNVKPSVLVVKGPPIDVEANQEKQKVVVPEVLGKPVIIVEGDRITPIIIKPVTQLPMVDTKAVPWNYKQVIVIYKGKEVEEEVNETGGLTRSGRCFTPEELRKAKPFKDGHVSVKKPVNEEEAEEFLKKMKMQDYSIIANKIFEANRITFSDDELPMEGTEHNRALYLTVKCEDSVVSRVLVDNGSSANICPLSTLQKLKIGTERIHMNNVCVRGFDGGGKDSVGDIMLELSIGPVEFTMEFQVLDVVVSYNLLSDRPWIHAAKDRQEIVVHGDEKLSTYNDTTVPFIEVEDDKGPWVYQTFDIVSVEKIPKGECIPSPKLPSVSIMVANEMLKNGFVPGKGLGSSLQGIAHLVCPRDSFGTFGLGFTFTGKDVKKAKNLKRKACSFYASFNDMTCMRNFQPNLKSQSNSETTIQEVECDDETEYDEEAAFQEINRELNYFEEKPKPNLNETEAINLGDRDNIRETKISVHLEPQIKEEIIKALFEYKDVFAWSYDDMPGLSTDLVVHKLPTDPTFPPVKQKLRKFKTDMSVKIKEEITKQLDA
ncbi:uncharacterized protein [Nicotiana tomentosiformis]|uniref:uncharacterized protein n=1 Tax=Nicotiana tomentosiformis TaxID=4098 RepID=UPI00388C94F9